MYPPSTAANQGDYILHVLAISVDGRIHTVLWTDSSSNVPAGISSIAQTIENMVLINDNDCLYQELLSKWSKSARFSRKLR